ncbi:MAG: endonuclease/exonuclease/phosphatase family protein [Planctomycetota bacterium]
MPRDGDAATILFWNIRAGGGPSRAQPILLELLSHEPDVVALAECRPTFAGQLVAALRDRGLPHCLQCDAGSRTNRVVLVSRLPLEALTPPEPRLLHARGNGLTVTACHVPDASDRTSRGTLFAKLYELTATHRDDSHLILGDFNANRADHPRRDGTPIGRLTALGYADLWLDRGGDPTEPTWVGPRSTNARIDHAYASKPLVSQVETIRQIHGPREAGLSDHSLLKLRVIHKTP